MEFKELERILHGPESFALFGHINPDGDAIGAMLALGRALKARGKSVAWFSLDGVPGFFEHMLLPGETFLDKHSAAPYDAHNPDAAVLLDCATPRRAGDEFAPIIKRAPVSVNIDHHVTNETFAAHNLILPAASSTCEILYEFMTACAWDITPDIAAALYLGVMYDTGRFIHGNTTPAVFRICSGLAARGADPAFIANGVYNNRSLASVRLLGYALNHMQTTADNRVAWAVIPRSVLLDLGATDIDTEGIVEALGRYSGCEAHMLFTEGPDGKSRASSRSTGRIKVNQVCQVFGGGGHDFAAGARNFMPLNELAEKFVAEVVSRLPARTET
jgi:phosphoesterase RecJ-like protein